MAGRWARRVEMKLGAVQTSKLRRVRQWGVER